LVPKISFCSDIFKDGITAMDFRVHCRMLKESFPQNVSPFKRHVESKVQKASVQHLALASPESQDLVFLSEHLGEKP
jgi:hypothetical protein